MGVSSRIGADLALLRDEAFADLCRSRPEDFTRRRKLPRESLVAGVLARKGRTLAIELRELSREFGMADPISKPGYLKARLKLNPRALEELARSHARGVYADGDFRAYKGMVVVAIDGSTANVPTTPETLARWGTSSSNGRTQAAMGISAAYDPLTRQLLDATLNRCSFNERREVPRHLAALPGVIGDLPYMVVLDRGYPSMGLLASLSDSGVTFVARCQPSFLEAEFRACEAAGGDLWVEARLTRKRLGRLLASDPELAESLLARGSLRVRLVLLDVGGGSPERIATNVGADVLSKDELAEVYHLRWGVETCFEFMKDRLQLENFTGCSPTLIEQDLWATAYLVNVAFDMANEAEAEALRDVPEGRYRHAMAVNRTLAVGILKNELIGLVLADDRKRDAMMADIVAELGRCLVPVRPDRPTYPRDGLRSRRACKYSNTHKRAF